MAVLGPPRGRAPADTRAGSEAAVEILHFDLSGIRLRLRGVPAGCSACFEREWTPFAAADDGEPHFDLRVRVDPSAGHAGTPLAASPLSPTPGGEARYGMPEGSIVLDRTGHGLIGLIPAGDATQYCALRNLLLAALAHRLPDHDVLLVHAAAIELDGSAFVLAGPPGTGKTTWVAAARQAGARSLGEDLVFVDLSGSGVSALAAPYRPDASTERSPGRWPLAALLLAHHGAPPALAPVPRIRALSRLVANLPHLSAERRAGPTVSGLVDQLVSRVAVRQLTFDPTPSYLPVLRAALRSGFAR